MTPETPETPTSTKPALASDTIRGNLVVILTAVASLIQVWTGAIGPEAIPPALMAIGGALWSMAGRYKARDRIVGVFKTPDA